MKKTAMLVIPLAMVFLLLGGMALMAATAVANDQGDDTKERDWFAIGQAKMDRDLMFRDRAQNRTDNWTAHGIDTTGMHAVIDEGYTVVIAPMEAALNSGDENAVKAALMISMGNHSRNYSWTCVHYFAYFALAGGQALLDHVTPMAIEQGLGDLLPPIQASIDSASSRLIPVGTSPYQPGQCESIWEDIREAREGLRDLIGQLRSAE